MALETRINDFLSGKDTTTHFSGQFEEAQPLILKALQHFTVTRTGQETLSVTGMDLKPRALGLHVPRSYTPSRAWPLVIWLHGGVSGTRQDRGAEVAHYFARESDSLSFLFAAPSGEQNATWFDEAGISNIQTALQLLKSRYNIDENRIILAGVSDGGTGCYLAGSLYPNSFAGFLVCSSSPDMLTAMGLYLSPINMKLRTWHIVHGGQDRLYPGPLVKTRVEQLKNEGIDLHFSYYPDAPHGLEYMPSEKPLVMQFILNAKRNALPSQIEYEATAPLRVSWLETLPQSPGVPVLVSASIKQNEITLQTNRPATLSVYLVSPLMSPTIPLRIRINGQERYNQLPTVNLFETLRFAYHNRDRTIIPFAKLTFEVK